MDNDFYVRGKNYSSVESFLCSQIDKEIKHSAFKTHDNYKSILRRIKNLNICVPFQYENWDYKHAIPDVAILDQKHIKSNGYANCYDKEGNPYQLHKKDGHPISPIITVGISERVDDEGFLVVNPYGFILENSADKISADYAYLMASSSLKSGKLAVYPQIWEVKDDDFFKERKLSQDNNQAIDYLKSSASIINQNNSTPTLQVPEILKIYPSLDENESIYLEWSNVSNATHYDIFRRLGESGEWNWCGDVPATSPRSMINRYCNKGLPGYYYTVQAKNTTTNEISQPSQPASAIASWRKGRGTENLEWIFFSESTRNHIGWLESRLEFYAIPILFNKQNNSIDYPRCELGSYYFPDFHITMNSYLFFWNLSEHSSNYFLYIYESDGGWSVQVNLGVKLFMDKPKTEYSASVSFTKKSLDDLLGHANIYHWESGDFIYLNVPVGQALISITNN